jgi:hypothetical protein
MSTTVMPKIDTRVVSIKDVSVIPAEKGQVEKIVVDGEQFGSTDRFWTSLFSRYGFNKQFFKYFSHAEVFDRINKTEKNDKVRLCIEAKGGDGNSLLAVSNPSKPIAKLAQVYDMLNAYEGETISYHNGELSSLHAPRIGGSTKIGGDLFHNRFSVNVPIDGYGQTNLYLAMLRQVCSNGAVAMSRAFRSTLQLGKNEESVLPTLVRALDSYNNDEGFRALRSRLESSTKSWASVYEAGNLYKNLIKMHVNDEIINVSAKVSKAELGANALESLNNTPILERFHKLTGDTSLLYGVISSESFSERSQRKLPMKCTMYDLINFGTEVSTHYSNSAGKRRIEGWFGTQISNEFDLEGLKDEFPDFADFHMGRKLTNGFTGSN